MFDHVMRLVGREPALYYADRVPESTVEEQAALVALLRERPSGMSWPQLAAAVLEHGGAKAARSWLVADTLFGDGLDDVCAEGEHKARLEQARRDVVQWLADGLGFWPVTDERYPARVRDIQEAPPFLFARGHRVDDDTAVSVVGSRGSPARGLQMAASISEALVSMGVTIVAGLAAGVDTAAHQAALRHGGRAVAVIGTGINRHYPAANRRLQEHIAHEGLLLSQFWPDAPPQRHNFPMRNAVMSGYGIATVIVDAGEHSGARIQARMAVHHGRPVILTDRVLEGTEWGKQILGWPDVHVASSTDEVVGLVHELSERPSQLGAVLSQITI